MSADPSAPYVDEDNAREINPFSLDISQSSRFLDFRPSVVTGDPKDSSVVVSSDDAKNLDSNQPPLPFDQEESTPIPNPGWTVIPETEPMPEWAQISEIPGTIPVETQTETEPEKLEPKKKTLKSVTIPSAPSLME